MKTITLLSLTLLLAGLSVTAYAQPSVATPLGGTFNIFYDCGDWGFGVDKKAVRVVPDLMSDNPNDEVAITLGDEDDFFGASVKDKTNNETLLVLTRKGKVYQVTRNLLAPPTVAQLATVDNLESFTHIAGDDMYATAYGMVYVTRNAGVSWIPDTLGLDITPFQSVSGIDLDTAQNVWLSLQGKLFMQPLISSTWTAVSNYPSNDARYIFADRNNRVWISGYDASSSYMTDNYGGTWNAFPSGLPAMQVISMCDDKFGNIYAVIGDNFASGHQLYKSTGGTGVFTRIDLPIEPLLSLNDDKSIYLTVSADSFILLTTKVGLLRSKDGGATWTVLNISPSRNISSISGHINTLLMATEQGIFTKPNGSTAWTKKLPVNGFTSNQQIHKDGSGNLYAFSHRIYNSDEAYPINMVYKSTDGGNNWVADTNGIHNIITEIFEVADNGQQVAAGAKFFAGQGNVYFVWKKDAGQSWVLDTVGLPAFSSSNTPGSFGKDDAGNIYLVVRGLGTSAIYKRAATASTWVFETNISANVLEVTGKSGKIVAATDVGMVYKTTGTWQQAANPSGLVPGPLGITAPNVQVDDNGVVWAYFENYSNAYGSYGEGVWYTTNFTTWQEPDNQIDTNIFTKLYAVGDSVFGVTVDGRVYLFDTAGIGTGVGIKDVAGYNSLSMYPNPANDIANILVSVEKGDKISLQVLALDGNPILQVNNVQVNGANSISINTKDLATGLYLCKLSVNSRFYTGKLSVLH